MRIALTAQEYPPETAKGGIGAQAILKAHGLAERGHEVHVISRAPDGVRSERMDGRVHVIRVPGFEKRMAVYTEIADWITYSAEICAALDSLHDKHPLDLVEFPEWGAEGFVYLTNRNEWNHVPVAIHLHGPLVMFARTMGWPDMNSEFFRVGTAMEAACLRNADAIYSSSSYSADWCAKEYGLERDRIPVIHTGIDTALFRPHPVPRDPHPTIVYVGKMVRSKGVVDLVTAACRLSREIPSLRVRLVGRDEENVIREIRAMAEAASNPHLLDMPGFTAREKIPELLSRSHVFAAPSPFEGGPGLMYLEAMACGLPVIACENCGAAEVVRTGDNGLLIPPGDVESLVDALRHLLTNQAERERMGVNAKRYVAEHADSQTCVDRIDRFFRSVAAGRSRKSP